MLVHSPPEIFGNIQTGTFGWMEKALTPLSNTNISNLDGRTLLNDFIRALPGLQSWTNLIYICIQQHLIQFLFIQSLLQLVPWTFFPLWQVLWTSSCIYQLAAIMLALTYQAVTSVPAPADMNWILMGNLVLVWNMNESKILILCTWNYSYDPINVVYYLHGWLDKD